MRSEGDAKDMEGSNPPTQSGTVAESSIRRTVLVIFNGQAYTFVDPPSALIDKESGALFLTDKENTSWVFSGTYLVREWKKP